MRVLLISTYELGHQPLHLASPAAALREAGHEVRCLDISVEAWDPNLADDVDAVAFSVPMHTAMRLAMQGAEALRRRRPELPIAFYGLYAPVSRDRTLGRLADRVIAGEYEPDLVSWVSELGERFARNTEAVVQLRRSPFHLPVREGLPPLDRYAKLERAGEQHLAGYVEATHGCVYRCRHCPVPVVYDGRTRKVPTEVVLADIEQQVEMGARHITFGDPDFLNRWRHATEVVEGMHERFPHLTYDVTTKVEHVLRYPELLPMLAGTGCLFVVSAFETLNDRILTYLDKGHTAADAERCVHLLRRHGIEVRPSWLPFTPWTSTGDVAQILDFVAGHDLVANVDPVQYTIRLLIPEGSLVLELPEAQPYIGPYDPERLTYTWRAADPKVDELQAGLAELVERSIDGRTHLETFFDIRDLVSEVAGRAPAELIAAGSTEGRPRLTEPWFC